MLRKFSNLPVIGSLLALLMFGVALSVGFGFELYRLGIIIPIGLLVLIVCFFVSAVKNGSTQTKVCLLIGFGLVAAVIGSFTLIHFAVKGMDEAEIRAAEQRKEWNKTANKWRATTDAQSKKKVK